ncbi:hypothetical protein RB653_010535 [Dictyostelium firmibasis]|uniref:Filament-interacting protein n=1 Tax=Dictyostelium firmibasis TaxID=79012 RepID=A0AAN7TTW4_9MYCE
MEKSFAQQMLEQLSENVSQLILTVLELKDKNANLPVVEVTAIANAASSISDIAIKLADAEYSNYPTIYNEIINTTTNMSTIKKTTIDCIANFQTATNKQQSWSNLIQSCKNIANETYKILKVIYDADIKRLKHIIEICKSQFEKNENSFGMIDREEFNEFGELVNQCISNLIEYSSCLEVKAKENQLSSPIKYQEESDDNDIIKLSKQLVEDANCLVDIVNDIFSDLDDPSQKQKFINHQNSLLNQLNHTFNLIQSNSPTLSLPEFTNINHHIQSPIPSQYSTFNIKTIYNENNNINNNNNNNYNNEINNNNNNINNNNNSNNNNNLLNDLIRGISKSCIEELRATCRGDPMATETISNSISQLIPILNDNINQYIKKNNNNNSNDEKEILEKSINKLKNELIPKYIQSAQLITRSSSSSYGITGNKNSEEINKMIEGLDSIQDCLNSIDSIVSTKEDQFLNAVKAKENVLTILSDHSIGDNTQAIVGSLKLLAKNQHHLEGMITDSDSNSNNNNSNNSINPDINEAISKLSELLPLQIQAAKLYLKDSTNIENRKQFTDISNSMKLPLTKIQSLMEPSIISDSNELLSKQENSSNQILLNTIPTAIGNNNNFEENSKLIDKLLKDLENDNSNLVGLIESELILSNDQLLKDFVKKTIDQLLEEVKNRRSIGMNKLSKSPHDKEIKQEFLKSNQLISDLSKSLIDCLKSFEVIPLLKLQLLSAHPQSVTPNSPKLQSAQKDINNRINSIVYQYKDIQKYDPLIDNQIKQLESFQNQLNQELSKDSNGSKDNLSYIIDNVVNSFNNLSNLPTSINGQDNEITTIIPIEKLNDELIDEINEEMNLEIIKENKENEIKRENERLEELKQLENLSNDQKLLKLFNDLIQYLKNNEANKSVVTLKQLIGEQEKLIQLANEIKQNSNSQDFKDQIDSSINLFKNSISSSIALAGKTAKINDDPQLTKACKTVKKSIIELTRLLKLNPFVEELSLYQLKQQQQQAQLLLPINENIIKGFKEHQINSRYYIETAYQVGKDDLISQSIEKIVYQQSELLKLASNYLASKEVYETLDPNIQLLLANSLETVRKSIVDQVESALSFLESEKSDEQIEKLLTILDTVSESVDNCSKSIFFSINQKGKQDLSPNTISQNTIKQSINSIIPTLTLQATQLQSNPNDKELERKHQQLLDQIIQPLEQLILNPNINQIIDDKEIIEIENELSSNEFEEKEDKKIKKLINDEKKELDKLESNALDSDSKGVVESSRSLVKFHQEILSLADSLTTTDSDNGNGNEDENQERNQIIKECSKELSTLIPLQLQTIKSMLQSKDIPTEASYQKKVGFINNQIKRNLNEIEKQSSNNNSNYKLISKTPYYSDQFKKLSNKIDNNGILVKDEQQLKVNLKRLEKLGEKCIDSSNFDLSRQQTFLDKERQQRIRDAINRLENKLNGDNGDSNLSNKINQYLKQPLNPISREQFENIRSKFQQSLDNLIDEQLSTPLQLLLNHSNLIQKLSRQSTQQQNNNGQYKIQETTKKLLENYQKLKQQLINNDIKLNETKKSLIGKSLKEIENLTPQLIIASTNCLNDNNNNDQKKREILENLQTKIESPIYEILNQLDPIDPIFQFKNLIKQYQATLIKLNDTIDSSSSTTINESNFKQIDDYISKLSNLQSNHLIPLLKQQKQSQSLNDENEIKEFEIQLKSKLNDVESISKDYLKNLKQSKLTDTIKAEKDMSISSLSNLINSIQSINQPKIEDNRIKLSHSSQSKSKDIKQLVDSIKSNNLLPIVESPNKIERYVSIQTNTTKPIFSNNNGKIISTAQVNFKPRSSSQPQKPILTNTNTIAITKPIRPIETRVPVKLSTQPTTSTTTTLPPPSTTSLQTKSIPIKTPQTTVATFKPIDKGASLEDSCINAANQMSNVIGNEQLSTIAKELESYANAIKVGDKKQILLCGRNISTLLNKYSSEVSNNIKSTPTSNKMLQTRCSHGIGVLQTLSCQFKILSSVKAASDEKDSDSDSQLTSMVNQLTSTLLDLNTSTNTLNKFKK